MRQTKRNEITIQMTRKLRKVFTNEKGQSFTVSMQMYSGKIKYRLREFDQFVPVKAFGLNLLIHLEDSKEPTSYDFGYLAPEGYLIATLIHALMGIDIKDFDHLRRAIRLEAATWGIPVYDLNGDPVTEAGRLKRDPFIRAAKKILRGLLAKARKRIEDASRPNNGKGVGM